MTGTPLLSPGFDLKTSVSSALNVTVTFPFRAIAHPKPEFQWFKMNDSSWNHLQDGNKFTINTIENYTNLTVRNITETDYGIYKLRIQNVVGSIEQCYFLNSKGKCL